MEVYIRGNNGMLKDIYRLDNTSQTRGGFEVANLRSSAQYFYRTMRMLTFDFTDPTISLLSDVRPAAKVSESALSSRGSPAFVPVPYFWLAFCKQQVAHIEEKIYVSLKVVCISETEPSGTVSRPDQICLGIRIWDSDRLGFPILIDAGTPNDGTNRVTISDGIVDTFEHKGGEALAASISVTSDVEALGSSVLGQELLVGQGEEHFGVQQKIGATNNGCVRLPSSEALASLVYGN